MLGGKDVERLTGPDPDTSAVDPGPVEPAHEQIAQIECALGHPLTQDQHHGHVIIEG